MPSLTRADVQLLRMRSLLLAPGEPPASSGTSAPSASSSPSVSDVVEWFGAMQAQDLASALWSLGVRLPGSTQDDITAALENSEALRTWPMRGTVHFVPPRDAKWMLTLMGARPLASAAKRRQFLGISDAQAQRAVDALRAALAGGKRFTRTECLAVLNDAGVNTANQASYHLLWYVSQLGIACIAPNVGKEQTFVLLDEYVPDPHTPERDEALGIVALRYVRGHGPVTVKEMARWTGLGVRDCRTAVAVAGDALVEVPTDDGPMLVAAALLDTPAALTGAAHDHGGQHLALPGFDEYMLGYGDRSLMLEPAHFQAVVPGNNGVFRSTLVRDGRVMGTWKRTMRAKACVVDAVDLRVDGAALGATSRAAFEAALEPYGAFVGKPVEVAWAAAA